MITYLENHPILIWHGIAPLKLFFFSSNMGYHTWKLLMNFSTLNELRPEEEFPQPSQVSVWLYATTYFLLTGKLMNI